MKPDNIHLIYFSPTGTTRETIAAVAEGLSVERVNRYDLTYVEETCAQTIDDGVAIIGIPVYAGRVPIDALKRLENFKARNIPTILIALYGNREFEDALVELCDVVTQKGFKVIAAGAFIGEHSYSTPERPIAEGRPDVHDLKQAKEFGQKVLEKLTKNDLSLPSIDGNHPYKDRVKFGGVAPETVANKCTLCGKCADACPVHVIKVSDSVVTQAENCIMCAACTRVCEFGARHFNHPRIEEKRALLIKNCSTPKPPTLFCE
jgi:ferredoxin